MKSYELFLLVAELFDDNQELMANAIIHFTSIDTIKNYRPVHVHSMVLNFNHSKLEQFLQELLTISPDVLNDFKNSH